MEINTAVPEGIEMGDVTEENDDVTVQAFSTNEPITITLPVIDGVEATLEAQHFAVADVHHVDEELLDIFEEAEQNPDDEELQQAVESLAMFGMSRRDAEDNRAAVFVTNDAGEEGPSVVVIEEGTSDEALEQFADQYL